MSKIDRIIEELLNDRRIRENAAFTTRTFSDQPLIERGRDLQRRQERRRQERAQRVNPDARPTAEPFDITQKPETTSTNPASTSATTASTTAAPSSTPADSATTPANPATATTPTPAASATTPANAARTSSYPVWRRANSATTPANPAPATTSTNPASTPANAVRTPSYPASTSAHPASIPATPASTPTRPTFEQVRATLLNNYFFPPADDTGQSGAWRFGRLPKRIVEMRRLERKGASSRLAYGSNASAALFYQQAKLMEDYEDSYEFSGGFQQYYPTYVAMSDQQLRGYFAWRTKLRAGELSSAPLSFAFVYAYELLCGIGTMPGAQGLHDLRYLQQYWNEATQGQDTRLAGYLRQWINDYIVYHNLEEEFTSRAIPTVGESVLVLLQAEHAQLRVDHKEPRVANFAVPAGTPAPTHEQLYQALGASGSYHLCESRMGKAQPELLADIAADVFAALVTHCARRRKTDFVEGLFGYASRFRYTIFPAAVFYEEHPHPDAVVAVSQAEQFVCKDGRWEHHVASDAHERNKELGAILHAIDYELRLQTDYPYPLKAKPVPKYVAKIVHDAVAAQLEARAEAEKRRITIDRSKLRGIRAAAAITQETLLTDEERGVEPAPVSPVVFAPSPIQTGMATAEPSASPFAASSPAGSASTTTPPAATPFAVTSPAGLVSPTPTFAATPFATTSDADSASTTTPSASTPFAATASPAEPTSLAPKAMSSSASAQFPAEASPTGTPSPATPITAAPFEVVPSSGPTTQAMPSAAAPSSLPASEPAQNSLLTPIEARLLQGLMDGMPASALLGPTDPFVSVVADSINEKFFDLVGDAVIEFDGDEPLLIDDYLDDIREVLPA